jgi:hypothetical protein
VEEPQVAFNRHYAPDVAASMEHGGEPAANQPAAPQQQQQQQQQQ